MKEISLTNIKKKASMYVAFTTLFSSSPSFPPFLLFLFINNLLRRRFKILKESSFYITMSISFHFSSYKATHFISISRFTFTILWLFHRLNKQEEKGLSEKRKEPFPVSSTVNKSINLLRITEKKNFDLVSLSCRPCMAACM